MADCCWHIGLDKPSSLLWTFNTPFGGHKFNRLPFGISWVSDLSQLMIERHFADIKALIAIHDNLIISAVSPSENDKTLRNVLERAKDRIIKFNLKKILLKVPEVKYLGNTASKEGFKADSEKIKAQYLKFPSLPKKRTK